ncbi:hypothetical protein OB236_11950 [Paenibacillus sp. WQ 127069]|uniref:Uncharacterized protein n=1 Tax=Paenibacillus baimaensis TaxID=2982185 RepID=A0ABT2UDW7_9BACL|nr:hypothetical protein [Paenibacillus sp. WQ 127069]MCU6792833.1 hypothetical protein [Paenibacillus sp. WQ 127069]
MPKTLDALTKSLPTAKAIYILMLKSKVGRAGMSVLNGFDRLSYAPKASKYPEDAVRWMDTKRETQTFKGMVISEESKH